MYLPSFFPLSLQLVTADDNDFEDSGTGNYAAINTALTKGTAAGLIRRGAQYGISTLSSANGYITPGNFNVFEGEQFHVAANAAVLVAGQTADLIAFDVTGSVAIDNATSGSLAWAELYFEFGVPSNSRAIQLRLAGTGASDVINWDDFQIWGGSRSIYQLPSWITRPAQLLDIRVFPQGTTGPASDNDYRADEQRSQPLRWGFEYEDRRAANELFIWVQGTSSRPYIYALRSLSELTSDTASTPADQDSVVFWAEKLIREPERAAHNLALVRSLSFTRPTKPVPRRVGVSM